MDFLKIYQNLYKTKLNVQKELNATIDSCIIHFANSFFQKKKTVFILAPNLVIANKLLNKLHYLCPNKTLFFPMDGYLTTISSIATGDFLKARINTILNLLKDEPFIVIGTYDSILKYQLPKEVLLNTLLKLTINQSISRTKLEQALITFGYQKNDLVEKKGEYSIRGDIIDFYPLVEKSPVRVVLDYEQIMQIKFFDINNQLSTENITTISITPLSELYYSNDTLFNYRDILNNISNLSTLEQEKILRDISYLSTRTNLDSLTIYNNIFGINDTILDYVKEKDIYFLDLELHKINQDTIQEEKKIINNYYNGHFFTSLKFIKDLNHINSTHNISIINGASFLEYEDVPRFSNKREITSFINKYNDYKFIISDNNHSDFKTFLIEANINYSSDLNKANIALEREIHAFNYIDKENKIIFLNAVDTLKKQNYSSYKINEVSTKTTKINSINDLNKNDYVVHYDYGIGQYLGLKTLDVVGIKKDFLYIMYQDNEAIYVALEDINLVLKYHYSGNSKVVLSKLGSKSWSNLKSKTKQKIKDLYNELLNLYQNRNNQLGFKFSPYSELENELASTFSYEETIDQKRTIAEIFNDMESNSVMERLVCGDVGFGKTEVAIRAAYRAVLNKKQVLVLVPTTILAKQHYKTFTNRLAPLGVNIGLYTRFQGLKESKEISQNFLNGKVDILIGTHKIIRSNLKAKDLGLYIIDEEQRFGVKDKEVIKYNHFNIDTIYLSATPIPRTLEMSLSGLKSISLITTPPKNRYPVQTYLLKKDYLIIKDIIQKELARGGQVFYLVNEISEIRKVIDKIKSLIPNINIGYLYGSMQKIDIDNTLEQYINGEIDLLVTTTIIENGIDIPNVNTIIIDDATKLGLAQIYQIKGRVGRSSQIAYCYLMYSGVLSEISKRRLDAIQSFNELGSGYRIAYEDLLLRGAGNFLGAEQSGFINNLGLEMYLELLNEVVSGQKIKKRAHNNLKIFNNQTIKKSYISKEALRIEIHKKINKVRTLSDLTLLENELIDRFGKLDTELTLFLYERLFHYQASLIQISDINYINKHLKITMPIKNNPNLSVKELFSISLLDNYYVDFKVVKDNLNIDIDMSGDARNWLFFITELLDKYFSLTKTNQ